jgi:hypothetical protein
MNSNYPMRQVSIFALFFFTSIIAEAQLLWTEDFLGEADGAQTGIAGGTPGGTWSTTAASIHRQDVLIANEILLAENTSSEQRWETNDVDISSAGYAVISADVWSALVDADDYLRLYYKVDGGSEILFYELAGGNGLVDFEPATPASAIVSGNSLQIVARFRNNTTTFLFWTLNSLYGLDNVTITPADILYSRKSGTWTDVTGGFGGTGTWSTNRSGTPACGCLPLNDVVAVIQNGHTVTLPTSQTAVGGSGTPNLAPGAVDVESGGVLQYNISGVTLGIQQGLVRVRSGGIVNSSSVAITGEQISFNANVGGATLQIDAGGIMSVEDLVLGTDATNLHYLAGGGTLTITDDILINANGGSLTNNRSASFTVGDDLDFNAANSSFTNNATITITDDVTIDANTVSITNSATYSLTITDDLSFNSDNSTFTNSGTATIGDITATNNGFDDNVVTNASGSTLNVGGITATDADMDVLNSGTINQSGNFTTINTADTNFDNFDTGVWNWTLTPNTTFDTDVATILNLTAIGNTFNYNGAGAQRIIPTTYHHISLSNSGAKDANNASFAVQGNWNVSGTATFTEGTGTITLNGSVAQTITNASGETFNNLIINNSFASSPQITLGGNITVSTVLTMTDGNVNLNGYTFRLSSSVAAALSHSLASTSGWMYGGNFARVRPASTPITVGVAHSLFPLGSDGDWRPFFAGQGSVAGTAGTMIVSHTNSTTTSTVAFAESIVRRHDSYWTVSTTATAGTYALRAGGTNFGTIASNAHIRMSTSTGVVGTHAAGSGVGPDWRVNRTAVPFASLANNYHVASTDATNSPLPIELLSFTAQLNNNFVELTWSTASESNNDYFTVERATNIEHFETVVVEDGKGTTKEVNRYKVVDPSPLYGRSYYRLKQTDFDGTYTYSSLQVVDYDGPRLATLTAFPNPLNDQNLTIKIEGLQEATEVTVQISNVVGQKIFDKVIKIKTPGIIIEEIPKHNFPTPGLYIIKAGETLYLTKKIVVK